MGIIRRTFKHLNNEIFIPLYKALVRPHLEYGNVIWNPILEKHIEAIEKVQRRATKLLPELRDLPYESRLRNLKLPTLAYRRLRGDMIEMYKLMEGIYDNSLPTLIQTSSTNTTRGHSKKIFHKRSNKTIRQRFLTLRAATAWNQLSESTISAPDLIKFEKRLDKEWQDQDIKYNYKAKYNPSCWRKVTNQPQA